MNNSMPITLLRVKYFNAHVSEDTLNDFENQIEVYCEKIISKKYSIIYRLKKKIINNSPFLNPIRKLYHKIFGANRRYISVIMGVNFNKCYPSSLESSYNYAYFFDAWPDNQKRIEHFILEMNIKTVFFSSKQVADIFREKLPEIKSFWIPEGVNPAKFKIHDSKNKIYDVIQYGRKHECYHKMICDSLELNGYTYKYEKIPGKIIFPDSFTFCKELSKCKISICFPSSITHPARSGNINTMTVRYLECMVSKCLIVGQMPPEMYDLFDYIPIIEIDFDKPFEQLETILKNYSDFQDLIDKNYDYVLTNHTWNERAKQMFLIISKDQQ
jgi:hypothetical protein